MTDPLVDVTLFAKPPEGRNVGEKSLNLHLTANKNDY